MYASTRSQDSFPSSFPGSSVTAARLQRQEQEKKGAENRGDPCHRIADRRFTVPLVVLVWVPWTHLDCVRVGPQLRFLHCERGRCVVDLQAGQKTPAIVHPAGWASGHLGTSGKGRRGRGSERQTGGLGRHGGTLGRLSGLESD